MRLVGVIENMTSEVFGSGGGAELAHQIGVPLLGTVPLDARVRECGDLGEPLVLHDPDSPPARAIVAIAERIAARRLPGDVKKPLKLLSSRRAPAAGAGRGEVLPRQPRPTAALVGEEGIHEPEARGVVAAAL